MTVADDVVARFLSVAARHALEHRRRLSIHTDTLCAAIAAVEPLIRAAEREKCAREGDQHADSLQQVGDNFAKVSPAIAAPYYVRAQDIRDLTATIRARNTD